MEDEKVDDIEFDPFAGITASAPSKKAAKAAAPAKEKAPKKDPAFSKTLKEAARVANGAKDDAVEKQALTHQILAYCKGKWTGKAIADAGMSYNMASLAKKDIEGLKDELAKIRFVVSCDSNNLMFGETVLTASAALEPIAKKVGFDITGVTAVCRNDEVFMRTAEEVGLKYMQMTYVEPEYRLAFRYLCHAYGVNRAHATLSKMSNSEVKELAATMQSKATVAETPAEAPAMTMLPPDARMPTVFETLAQVNPAAAPPVEEPPTALVVPADPPPTIKPVDEPIKAAKKVVRKPKAALKPEPAAKQIKVKAPPKPRTKKVDDKAKPAETVKPIAAPALGVQISTRFAGDIASLSGPARAMNEEFMGLENTIELPKNFMPS